MLSTVIFAIQTELVIGMVVGLIAAGFFFLTRKKSVGTDESTTQPDTVSSERGQGALFTGLQRTREEGFIGRMAGLFRGRQLDEDILNEVEEVLFTSDIGVKTSDRLLTGLKDGYRSGTLTDADSIWTYLRNEAQAILENAAQGKTPDPANQDGPCVVLMVGVNGTGKTTTTGKLAARWKGLGKHVFMGAGDTFRAAAVEQLQAWGKRVDVQVFSGNEGSDPASVLFDATKGMSEKGGDILLADTAGRLHTHAGLLDELKKVVRVIGKAMPGAPHHVWLVLDGTTGQNAIQQARVFGEAVDVTGIILTKLDGTAKGGVVLGIADELKLPIHYIGIGEKVEDLRPFEPDEFVDALFPALEETE